MNQEIKLPELGDGIEGGAIVALNFKEGDTIQKGETIAEIETDKAVLGIPSTIAGKLIKWHIEEGKEIKVGDILLSVESLEEKNTTESNGASINEKKLENDSSISPEDTKNPKRENQRANQKSSPSPSPSTTTIEEVIIQDLGDQIETGTVVMLHVSLGDKVEEDKILFEIETDKAVAGFPSPIKGIIKEIFIKEGDEIKVGTKGFLIEKEEKENTSIDNLKDKSIETEKNNQYLSEPNLEVSPESKQEASGSSASSSLEELVLSKNNKKYHAGPATRKLARELGIDLSQVSGSGRSSRIMIEDIKSYTKKTLNNQKINGKVISQKKLPDFNKWGKTKSEKVSKLRDTISQHISFSWNTIPHVHQYDDLDISHIYELQKKWKEKFEKNGSVFSITPFVIKTLVQCLKEYPVFNSSYDEVRKEIIYKNFFNIGVAVDTADGLIVPVIKNVDQLSLFDIGVQLKEIAIKTRERSVKPDDLKGGSITLSNLGGIGGSHFNPIVNWPEVAILGIGRGKIKPVFDKNKNEFIPKMILPTCLAYDHRVIDGALGARFIVSLKSYLENPELLLMGFH